MTPVASREEALTRLQALSGDLRARWGIRPIAIFGSFARGDIAADSDIDVLVEFERPIGLAITDAAAFLEAGLGRKVDLVSRKWMRPRLWRVIAPDLVNVEA